jgi:hypothetical protein
MTAGPAAGDRPAGAAGSDRDGGMTGGRPVAR